MEPYKRIPCGVYDHFEIAAMRQTPSVIKYRNANQEELTINDVVTNLKSIDKVEYAILKSGLQIRLDWIVAFNEMVIQDEKGCYL